MAVSRAELSISGKRYLLSCAPGQEARLEELGARFDARVRELAEAMGDIGPERLFLAAGLSFIDELDIETAGGNARALDERRLELRHCQSVLRRPANLRDAEARPGAVV